MISSVFRRIRRARRARCWVVTAAVLLPLAVATACGSEDQVTKKDGAKPPSTTTEPDTARETDPPTSSPGDLVPPAAAVEGTRWTLTRTIEPGGTYAVPEGVDAWIHLSDGRLSGSAGCNRITGAVTVTPPGNAPGEAHTIDVGPVAATRMACVGAAERVERHVLKVLDGRVRASVRGTTLTLDQSGGLGLVFQAPATCAGGSGACEGESPTVGPGSPGDEPSETGTTEPLSEPPTQGQGLERPKAPPTEPKVPRPAD